MRKALLITTTMVLVVITLIGCKKPQSMITVEYREYLNDAGKITYNDWIKSKTPASKGKQILSNGQYHISVFLESVNAGNVKVKFSDKIFFPARNQISDVFILDKNKTYVFELGSGLSGLEVKIRYN